MMRALGGKALGGRCRVCRTPSPVIGAGRGVIEEPIGEVAQEGINQLGRMSVNPNIDLMAPDAVERYKESFFGSRPGAVLGGAFGAMERPTPAPPPPAPQPVPPVQVETAVPGGAAWSLRRPRAGGAQFSAADNAYGPGALTPFDLNAPDGGRGLEQVTSNPQFQQLFSQYQAAELAGDQEGMAQAVRQAQLLAAQQMQASPDKGSCSANRRFQQNMLLRRNWLRYRRLLGALRAGNPLLLRRSLRLKRLRRTGTGPEPPAPTGAVTEVDGVKLYTTRGAERWGRGAAARQARQTAPVPGKPHYETGVGRGACRCRERHSTAVSRCGYAGAEGRSDIPQPCGTSRKKGFGEHGQAQGEGRGGAVRRRHRRDCTHAGSGAFGNEEGDMTYEPYGPHADIHRLIQARDQQVSQFSSAKSNKRQTKHAEEMRGNTMAPRDGARTACE